ncbi:DUF4145 domain-containing protein [Pseudomonas putida]|nr:DUF4145 domain-containing protein [Pseudomonas putida]
MTALIGKRFVELEQQLAGLEAGVTRRESPLTGSMVSYLDSEKLLNWGVKVTSLLERLGPEASTQLRMFAEAEKPQYMDSTFDCFKRMKAVFLAVKEDFEGGYLISYRSLVQAEVFTSELDQARDQLNSGYRVPAAVIAGIVLETKLRDMCTPLQIPLGKLDKMNADLAKAQVYNSIQQKRITAIAGIRNSAAHGKPEEFTPADVQGMIDDVERFLAAHP